MFEDWTIDELKAARRSLEDALARGVNSVNYNGEAVSFSNQDHVRATLADIRVAIRNLDPNASRPAAIIYISTSSKGI